MSLERPVLLSALPPTLRQERLALAVAALLFAALLARLPVGTRLLPRQDAFIPIVDTILFFSDLITAVLLYAQYSVVRSREYHLVSGPSVRGHPVRTVQGPAKWYGLPRFGRHR